MRLTQAQVDELLASSWRLDLIRSVEAMLRRAMDDLALHLNRNGPDAELEVEALKVSIALRGFKSLRSKTRGVK